MYQWLMKITTENSMFKILQTLFSFFHMTYVINVYAFPKFLHFSKMQLQVK